MSRDACGGQIHSFLFTKVKMLNDLQKNDKEDGYQILTVFFTEHDDIKRKIQKMSEENGYTSVLAKKYLPDMPMWVLVELLSFGDLNRFYTCYYTRYPIGNTVSPYLWSARMLRNAAAHNSCLLNRLLDRNATLNRSAFDVIKKIMPYKQSKLANYMKCTAMQDIIVMLILYTKIVKSTGITNARKKEIKIFFHRCRKHSSYFKKNIEIQNTYTFFKKAVESILQINS
jgi:abortive infection bacteriophage resistance protein